MGNMGNSGCVKYCAPTMYDRAKNKLVDCQCAMVKRLACWYHKDLKKKGAKSVFKCGQFKELLSPVDKTPILSWADGPVGNGSKTRNKWLLPIKNCKKICAQQLA